MKNERREDMMKRKKKAVKSEPSKPNFPHC